ncbi:hypothetical protein HDU98_009604, partial [Podochytrium sp. JEL0797]
CAALVPPATTSVTTALASLATSKSSTKTTTSIPVTPTITYNGCYEDKDIFNWGYSFFGPNMTPELCAQWVSANPWLVTKIGLFNGDECFYGYSLAGAPQEPSQKCRMQCVGDSSKECGGAYDFDFGAANYIVGISVYTISTTKTPSTIRYPSSYAECATGTTVTKVSTSDRMTPELCAKEVLAENFELLSLAGYGLKNGNECWFVGAFSEATSSQGCSMPCAGDSSQRIFGVTAHTTYIIKF